MFSLFIEAKTKQTRTVFFFYDISGQPEIRGGRDACVPTSNQVFLFFSFCFGVLKAGVIHSFSSVAIVLIQNTANNEINVLSLFSLPSSCSSVNSLGRKGGEGERARECVCSVFVKSGQNNKKFYN